MLLYLGLEQAHVPFGNCEFGVAGFVARIGDKAHAVAAPFDFIHLPIDHFGFSQTRHFFRSQNHRRVLGQEGGPVVQLKFGGTLIGNQTQNETLILALKTDYFAGYIVQRDVATAIEAAQAEHKTIEVGVFEGTVDRGAQGLESQTGGGYPLPVAVVGRYSDHIVALSQQVFHYFRVFYFHASAYFLGLAVLQYQRLHKKVGKVAIKTPANGGSFFWAFLRKGHQQVFVDDFFSVAQGSDQQKKQVGKSVKHPQWQPAQEPEQGVAQIKAEGVLLFFLHQFNSSSIRCCSSLKIPALALTTSRPNNQLSPPEKSLT